MNSEQVARRMPGLTGKVRPSSLVTRGIKISMIVIETALVVVMLTGAVSVMVAAATHLVLMVLLGLAIIVSDELDFDSSDLQLFLISTVAAGPAGALIGLLAGTRNDGEVTQPLREWYDTIAPPLQMAVTLYDRIRDGRSVRPDAFLPQRFDAVLEKGTMREKQAVLTYLATHYHPDYARILRIALESSDPAVRVQASAVGANLRARSRNNLAKRLKEMRENSGDEAVATQFDGLIRDVEEGNSQPVPAPEGQLRRRMAGRVIDRSTAEDQHAASA